MGSVIPKIAFKKPAPIGAGFKTPNCKIAELIAKILESYAFHTAKMAEKDTMFFLLHAEFFKYRCQNLFYRAVLQYIVQVVAFNKL